LYGSFILPSAKISQPASSHRAANWAMSLGMEEMLTNDALARMGRGALERHMHVVAPAGTRADLPDDRRPNGDLRP